MKRVGHGETAEVYEWDEHRVIKLYRPGFEILAERESQTTQAVAGILSLAPMVYDIVTVKERKGLLMDYVHGKTLLDAIDNNLSNIFYYAGLLGREHRRLHNILPDRHLPRLKPVLKENFAAISCFPEDILKWLEALYDSLPDGRSINHGDFMPGNIIVSESGKLVALDWADCLVGDPLADVARTANFIVDDNDAVGVFGKINRHAFLNEYLTAYFALTEIPWNELIPWLLINGLFEYQFTYGGTDNNIHSQRLKDFILKNWENREHQWKPCFYSE